MTFSERVEKLRSLHVTTGHQHPTQLLVGVFDHGQMMSEVVPMVTQPNLTNEPDTYQGLIIVRVPTHRFLALGTVTLEQFE